MDEPRVRELAREIILDNHYESYLDIDDNDRNRLLVNCIEMIDLDWLFDNKVIDKIMKYILASCEGSAMELAAEIKTALSDYYEAHLETLFDDTVADIARERREAGE